MPVVLMHISDLHFHRMPVWPGAYFSKRLLGAGNLLLRRRKLFPRERARALVQRLTELKWEHLLISGDLTQLGQEAEFALARAALQPLLEAGPERVTVLPGNHDRYVREAPRPDGHAGAFEAYFGDFCAQNTQGCLHTRPLGGPWWLAGWDSAAPAPWLSAAGRVSAETLKATSRWMAGLPTGARVIVANHYPAFYPPPHHYRADHDLLNKDEVADWLLGHPAVTLYLHGHIHHNWRMVVPRPGGPSLTVVNSASSTQIPRPGDTSAFHRIVLEDSALGDGGFRVEPLVL